MTIQTLVLTDADAGVHLDHGELRPNNTMELRGSPHWSIRWRTLRGGVSDGVDVVELDNGRLSLCILPTRGMGIWKGRFNDLPLEWKSPVERPVHPKFVNQLDRGGIGWLHGFNELLCRCGLSFLGPPGEDRGEKLTLHGRITNLPAHRVEVRVDTSGPGSLELRGVVDETSMFGSRWRLTSTYRMEAGSNRCAISDEITNLGGQPAELSLLYHINVGRPFLEPYASYSVPSIEVAPKDVRAAQGIENYQIYGAPVAGFQEQVYFHTPIGGADGWSTALLANASGHAGFAVHFQTRQLPTFTVWKNTVAEADGYVTGLEPGIVFPNFRGFERERGRLPLVQPGHTYRSELALEVADTLDSVRQITDRIHLLQGKTSTMVHRQPVERLSPTPK